MKNPKFECMNSKKIKKYLLISFSAVLFFVSVLAIHIYWINRPKAADANTIALARIDIKQPIDQEDAATISNWLYQQKAVDHVLVNPKTSIVVFSFYPIESNADKIVSNFKSALPYKAERFIPTEKQLQSGCPIAKTSMTYKIYTYFKNL